MFINKQACVSFAALHTRFRLPKKTLNLDQAASFQRCAFDKIAF